MRVLIGCGSASTGKIGSTEYNIQEIYKAIKKYLTPEEEKNIHQILNMMHTMENVKEMQKMMEFFPLFFFIL